MKNNFSNYRSISLLLFFWFLIQGVCAQSFDVSQVDLQKPILKVHKDDLWKAMIKQWFIVKFDPINRAGEKIELANPALRVDLSLYDMVDQVATLIQHKFGDSGYDKELIKALTNSRGEIDIIGSFDKWYVKLNELAAKDPDFKQALDFNLVVQQYDLNGVALTDGIGMLRLARIREIEHYNKIILDPEGEALMKKLSEIDFSPLMKGPITVERALKISPKKFKKLKREHYEKYYSEMQRLELLDFQKYGGDTRFAPRLKKFSGGLVKVVIERDESVSRKEDSRKKAEEKYFKHIFNALERLQDKHRFTNAIDKLMNPKLPRTSDGIPMMTPSFLQEFEEKLTPIIKDLTWRKQLSVRDDETLWEFRKWIKRHKDSIKEKLAAFNQANQTNLELPWLDKKRMPHTSDVIESYEILRTIYGGTEPWQKHVDAVMRNRRGKEVVIGHNNVGTIIHKLGHGMKNVLKTENLAGLAVGGGALILSGGNLAIAMTANSVVHDIVANRKYERDPKELLTKIPMDIISGAMIQTGAQPGRIFNVMALGAGQGLVQGVVTKQDPFKSAVVGATFEVAMQGLPAKVRYPVVPGVTTSAMLKNASLEIFSTTAKTTFKGGVVAILDKKDVVDGMKRGAIYGAAASTLTIAILGVRYDPLAGHSESDIQKSIDEENVYDNTNGAPGGNYQITKKMIEDTPFRKGGLLTEWIWGSITLPGSVSMYKTHAADIDIVTHEAHHLSQQEQLGMVRFYYLYLYQSVTVPYEDLTFEISPH